MKAYPTDLSSLPLHRVADLLSGVQGNVALKSPEKVSQIIIGLMYNICSEPIIYDHKWFSTNHDVPVLVGGPNIFQVS